MIVHKNLFQQSTERRARGKVRYAKDMDDMNSQTPVILLDHSSVPAYSLFNPNDWGVKSKQIVQSCAVNYGLLAYAVAKIDTIFSQANSLCQPKFQNLVLQWERAKWDVSSCTYLVDIPEAHLSIHAFLSTVKTFLDLLVQLFHTEGVVHAEIHGFHKKGDNVGGKLLHMLTNNATKPKKHVAVFIHDLICEHKKLWIDHVVSSRDAFIHPESGLSKVMFALDLYEADGELVLGKILKPSFYNEEFDAYARKTVSMVDIFSKKCIEYIKTA